MRNKYMDYILALLVYQDVLYITPHIKVDKVITELDGEFQQPTLLHKII